MADISDAKIVGGRRADDNTWPWLVLLHATHSEYVFFYKEPFNNTTVTLLFSGLISQCGGTIISDTRILTAAHCFKSSNVSSKIFSEKSLIIIFS